MNHEKGFKAWLRLLPDSWSPGPFFHIVTHKVLRYLIFAFKVYDKKL